MRKIYGNYATPTMRTKYNDFKMPTICKRCHYRRELSNMSYVSDNNWGNSCCVYHLVEGEFRNCETTDTYCGKFRKKERTKK